MRNPDSDHPDRRVIEQIGVETVVQALNVKPLAVQKWMKRGVPWKLRGKFARLAAGKRIRLPNDFTENRAVAA